MIDLVTGRLPGRWRGGEGQEGQGLAEYALILTFIAIVVIGAVAFLGGQLNTMMSGVGQSI